MTAIPALMPNDAFNRKLRQNVRPGDWRNPTPSGRYNLVVVGAGTAGLVSAAGAAGLGAKVALVERSLMGGDCLNVGCVPSKAIIAASRVAAAVRDAAEFGVQLPGSATVDFAAAMERMRRLRANISPHDSARRFRELGVDVYFGDGRFVDASTLEVDGAGLSFSKAIVAAGARAEAPPIPGLDSVEYLTNETVFTLTQLPAVLGVVGAGPIGCEMAQAFARLGSRVYLIETEHGVLPREDREAAAIVAESLARDGVKLLCCGRALAVSKDGDKTRLRVDSHDASYDEPLDALLIAAGRKPNVERLNLEGAAIEYDEKGIAVNDFLQTTNRRVYAAGDICTKYQFTHAADFMARLALRNALFHGRARMSKLVIPWCTYTAPEVAHVGLYKRDAEKQGIETVEFQQDLAGVDRAVLEGETEGFAKVLVAKGKDRILGATIVAPHAGDLISQITLAMNRGVGLKAMADVIHPYPTVAEAIRKVGDQYNRTRLTPWVKRLFKAWLNFTR